MILHKRNLPEVEFELIKKYYNLVEEIKYLKLQYISKIK